MVRPDHEDGEVLNSPDDAELQPEQPDTAERRDATVVRRSSPLSRRKKPKAAKRAAEASGIDDDAQPAEASDVEAGAVQAEALEPDDVETDAAASEVAESEVAESGVTESDGDGADGAESAASAKEKDGAVEPDPDELSRNAEYRERRRNRAVVRKSAAGREVGDRSSLTVVAVAATAFIVVAGIVLSAVFGVQAYRINQDRELRAEYSSFAQKMVVSLFTLNADNADQMYKNVMENTSGRAKQMFQENMKNTAKMIREGDMVTKATVLADAVSKIEEDEGSVLVVLDWIGHPKKEEKAAQSASFRLRVDITRINGDLKMTYLDWVA